MVGLRDVEYTVCMEAVMQRASFTKFRLLDNPKIWL